MRILGLTLVLVGLLPLAVPFAVYWLWARHMYTIGVAVDAHAITVLTFLGIADLTLLAGGIYFLRKSQNSN